MEGDGIGKGGSVIGGTVISGHASDAGRGLGACARAEEPGGAWERATPNHRDGARFVSFRKVCFFPFEFCRKGCGREADPK